MKTVSNTEARGELGPSQVASASETLPNPLPPPRSASPSLPRSEVPTLEEGDEYEGFGDDSWPVQSAAPKRAELPFRLPLDPEHETIAAGFEAALRDGYPDAGPDERLLLHLAGQAQRSAVQYEALLAQVARRAVLLIDRPEHVLTLARVLKTLESVATVNRERTTATLTAAAALRAQRHALSSRGCPR